MLLSVRAESNQRRAKGASSTNTWLTPVFIGVAPLDPPFTGACPFSWYVSSGGLSFDRAPSYSRALGPTNLKFTGGRL